MSGCTLLSPSKQERTLRGSSPRGPITMGEMEQEIQDLADGFSMAVAEACDRVSRQSPDPGIVRSMLFFKLRNASSAYDVVSAGDPLEGMLDLVTLIELQNIVWVDEGRIQKLPGGDVLGHTLGRAREDAWALAARALTKDQQEKVRKVIQEWRQRNPDVQWVSFVRFNSRTGSASFSLLNDIRSGLGGILDPLGSTTRSVDESRDLAAKALFYAKRFPILLGWESEAAVSRIADLPLVTRLEQETSSISRSVTDLPGEARSLVAWLTAGLAALLLIAFALLAAYRRLSLGWERKLRPVPSPRPPTRVFPAP